MGHPVLVLGLSGAGKSSAIRTLPPEKTFLFRVCSIKELPFKSAKMYNELKNGVGNMIKSDDYNVITKGLEFVKNNRPDTKYIVIDDSQYLLVNEFMRRHGAAGKGNDVFTLYNQIADHFWNLIMWSQNLSDDMFMFFLHHAEQSELGILKPKTVGKLLDEKVDICGMFTYVFLVKRDGSDNYFLTQNDGTHPAKTPMGMFENVKISNDLLLVANTIKTYYEGE